MSYHRLGSDCYTKTMSCTSNEKFLEICSEVYRQPQIHKVRLDTDTHIDDKKGLIDTAEQVVSDVKDLDINKRFYYRNQVHRPYYK
jgi:hypothetical protein